MQSHRSFIKGLFVSLLFMSALAFSALTPSVSYAAGLTTVQVSAILGLLRAFGASDAVVANVSAALNGAPIEGDPPPVRATTTPYVRPPLIGSPYASSNTGYDLSFNTIHYPELPFGFAVIGATAGRAFTHNAHAASEFSWARLSSKTAPTIYLNLNAPYGSSAISANVSGPKSCDTPFGAATFSKSAGGTYPDPRPCAGYNYGFTTAKDAYAYTSSQPYVASSFWWLDIEEANSWSDNTAVNDQVIQGAIDYLNSKGIRAGIYSVPFMWNNIAGKGFTPTQNAQGETTTPTWFPIGISNQVGALNACLDHASFIPGSPVWIIQYEIDHTAVDQNIAC